MKDGLQHKFKAAKPLIAILRGVSVNEVVAVGHCLLDAGFNIIEVPLNSPDPLRSIELLAKTLGETAVIGAGTVLNAQQATDAINAGSQIIIAPNFNAAVAKQSTQAGMLYVPGVATPTEAFNALDHGAHALKLFPAEMITPSIVSAMKAVLPVAIDLFAVGGINTGNMQAYKEAGISGFGIGSALYKPGKTLDDIKIAALEFVAAC